MLQGTPKGIYFPSSRRIFPLGRLTLLSAPSTSRPIFVQLRHGLLASQAKTLMLRGKHVHAIEVARETLAAADVLDNNSVRGRALNALGTSLMAMGEVEQGARVPPSTFRSSLGIRDPPYSDPIFGKSSLTQ